MKKLLKHLQKSVILALLCLTVMNTVTVPTYSFTNSVSTCSESTDPNEDNKPWGNPPYS